ncbi:MAG TPA: ATP-dependent Clp protease adapter ClpS [Actinopolymorphaceae bacterium]
MDVVSTAPVELERPDAEEVVVPDTPWVTIVWNDPINLMSYVTYVFQTYFHYSRQKAEKLMMDVHHKGKAVVSSGTREEMERDVEAMHSYGLWATLEKSGKGGDGRTGRGGGA